MNTRPPTLPLDAKENSPHTISKQQAIETELEWARAKLQLQTLDTRDRDALDFHEIPVWTVKDIIRHAFESGYREGLQAGHEQERTELSIETRRRDTPIPIPQPQLDSSTIPESRHIDR